MRPGIAAHIVVGSSCIEGPSPHPRAGKRQRIAALAAPLVKKVHLELGGKDSFVACEDADLDVAVPGVAWAALLNAGQVSASTERVYVQQSIFNEFTTRTTEHVQSLQVGPGMDQTTDIGPMARAPYGAKVEHQVEDPDRPAAKAVIGKCLENGLLHLTCGPHDNTGVGFLRSL
jgi:acyl-CoA reductase-like NAD-dependent aldehyde dehydrogenase